MCKGKFAFLLFIQIFLFSCEKKESDSFESMNFLNNDSENTTVRPDCTIAQSTPEIDTSLKVSTSGGAMTFTIVPNASHCEVLFALNDVPRVADGMPFIRISSTDLQNGSNTLAVTVKDEKSSVSGKWIIVKNIPPRQIVVIL